MHYLSFGARLNKGILMVTQLNQGFQALFVAPPARIELTTNP